MSQHVCFGAHVQFTPLRLGRPDVAIQTMRLSLVVGSVRVNWPVPIAIDSNRYRPIYPYRSHNQRQTHCLYCDVGTPQPEWGELYMSAETNMLAHGSRSQKGFSLIEVLVALLVLSIGLLGLAALQTTSLQFNTGSYFRTQATFLAYDILDRMRANSAAVADSDGNGYDQPVSSMVVSGVNCHATNCTSAELALYDVRSW